MKLFAIVVIGVVAGMFIFDWLQFKLSQNVDREDWVELERYADRYKAAADVDRNVDNEDTGPDGRGSTQDS